MLSFKENINLKTFNTFGVDAIAKKYFELNNLEEANELMQSEILSGSEYFILGGGSNLLLTKDYEGLIIHPILKGKKVVSTSNESIFIEVNSGENWDEFVNYCVCNNYGGIENLSLIPGNIGASAIQNIGAYGKEAKDVISKVHGFNLQTRKFVTYTNKECEFGYRSSIFKTKLENKFLITSVEYKLTANKHQLDYSYGAIKPILDLEKEINLISIRNAVIAIREQKLPNPAIIGNAGSFFKNPIVSVAEFDRLKVKFEDIPNYALSNLKVKIPAAWLIDKCGWKGYKEGNVGVHENQPLVIVNLGNAKGDEILALSDKIKASVFDKFNITLEEEVIIL